MFKSEILTQTEDIIRKSKNDLNDKIESTKLELLKISFKNERIKTPAVVPEHYNFKNQLYGKFY